MFGFAEKFPVYTYDTQDRREHADLLDVLGVTFRRANVFECVEEIGEIIAEAIVKKVPEGNYVVINGAPADNNSTMIHEGFYKLLQPYIDNEKVTIVHELWAENWREEYAYNAVSRLMLEGVQVDAIICANDLLAEGAISALSEYGLAGEIPVSGQDANISACQRIVDGKQLMTVYKPLKNLAEGAVELVYTMLHNQEVSEESTINSK